MIKKIQKNLNKKFSKEIICSEENGAIKLEGEVSTWNEVYLSGKIAANSSYRGVINKLKVKNLNLPSISKPLIKDTKLQNKKVDVVIIGGGIIGCSIARELSKWKLKTLLVDKEYDLAVHTSSRNDGMIHPGIAPKPGSKKAIYNTRGNKMYTNIAKDLDIEFNRTGSIILYDKWYLKFILPILKIRAHENKVKMEFLNKKELKQRENYLSDEIEGGILFPDAGIVSPYKTTIAFGESAAINGVEFSLDTIVTNIITENNEIKYIETNRGKLYPKVVINAAGVFSDELAEMAGDRFFTIHPRKGEIALLDKKKGHMLYSILSKPTLNLKSTTKGGGLVKTVEGNILAGPTAIEQPFKEDYTTTSKGLNSILNKHFKNIKGLRKTDIITYFSGIRASTYKEDFIIERSQKINNLVHAAGIQSPGFASAPAIAEDISKITIDILKEKTKVVKKENWISKRKKIPSLKDMSFEERKKLIHKNSNYGEIICRCEEISKGEIIDAIHSPIPATTVDGIKKRVRAGMGRCQGGFCAPLVVKILKEELSKDILEITKKGKDSYMVIEETKRDDKNV